MELIKIYYEQKRRRERLKDFRRNLGYFYVRLDNLYKALDKADAMDNDPECEAKLKAIRYHADMCRNRAIQLENAMDEGNYQRAVALRDTLLIEDEKLRKAASELTGTTAITA